MVLDATENSCQETFSKHHLIFINLFLGHVYDWLLHGLLLVMSLCFTPCVELLQLPTRWKAMLWDFQWELCHNLYSALVKNTLSRKLEFWWKENDFPSSVFLFRKAASGYCKHVVVVVTWLEGKGSTDGVLSGVCNELDLM